MKKYPADSPYWDNYASQFGYVNPHTGKKGAKKEAESKAKGKSERVIPEHIRRAAERQAQQTGRPTRGGLSVAGPSGKTTYFQEGGITEMAPDSIRQGVEQAVGMPEAMPEEVMLRTATGEKPVPGGGIASVETEFVAEKASPPVDIQDPLVAQTVQAVLGRVDQPDGIINAFVEKYGTEAFRQLRNDVLRMVEPNAQTEGMITGAGGGMDDQVMGMIGDQQRVAVSPGEYIVPADVVSGIGDGSSEAGAEELDEMLDEVRMARQGGTIQPQPYEGALPA